MYVNSVQEYLFIRLSSPVVTKNFHLRNPKPPFELGYLISILRKHNHRVKLIDCIVTHSTLNELVEQELEFNPDTIVISALTYTGQLCLDFSTQVKRHIKTKIIVVGQYASSIPENFIFEGSPVDIAILVEPEATFSELAARMSNGADIGDVRSVYTLHNRKKEIGIVEDLDSLPQFPHPLFIKRYKSYYPVRGFRKLKWGYMLTSRGCPHSCIFCSSVIRETYGKELRLRNTESIHRGNRIFEVFWG